MMGRRRLRLGSRVRCLVLVMRRPFRDTRTRKMDLLATMRPAMAGRSRRLHKVSALGTVPPSNRLNRLATRETTLSLSLMWIRTRLKL